MEFLTKHKGLLWGGAAVVAVIGGLYLYSNASAASANTANSATTGYDPNLASELNTPLSYSSGTGAVPLDNSSIDGSGQSSLDYLNALTSLQSQTEADTASYNQASLAVEQQLGNANINANTALGQANISAATTSTLATLAQSVQQAVINAKATNAASGVVQGGGQTLSYTVEQVSGNPKYNVGIEGPGGTIRLANTFTGQTITGGK